MTNELTIDMLEGQLRAATLAGDVQTLDALIADDVTFIDHLGRRVGKLEELEAHRTGILKLEQLDVYDRVINLLDNAASVSLRARVSGTYYGEMFAAKIAYTRVWVCRQDVWRVIAVHYSMVTM